MTKCTSTPLTFSSLNHKSVQVNFEGGHITSDAGILLVREVDKQLQLTQQVGQVIQDNRHPSYIHHSVEQLVKQRVYALAAGYEDINDHDQLRHDLAFQTAVGREEALASSATLCRFENSIQRRDLVKLSQLLVEQFIASFSSPPTELILDFDPTDHEIYGHQEQRQYHGYYRSYCFLPLHVFCGQHLLVSLLRPSNMDGAKYAGAILRLLVRRLRQAWPEVQIIFRGDCAFARPGLLHWCEQHRVSYVVGIGRNARLESLAKPIVETAQNQYQTTQMKQRLFDTFFYQAKSWPQERRVIVKAEHHDHGTNTRFVLTNLEDAAQTLYDQHYCPRGDMENKIKQLKLDLFSSRNSCSDFLANQFRLLLSSLAYVLISALKRLHLSQTSLKQAYCQRIRLQLFKVGAVIIKNTRRIQFLLSSHYPYQNEFQTAFNSLNSS